MVEFFTENELISHNQSGLTPGDSDISQLVFFTQCVYQSLDDDLETRAVFLDISKAFENWESFVRGSSLQVKARWYNSFYVKKKQRVVLNGQHSY